MSFKCCRPQVALWSGHADDRAGLGVHMHTHTCVPGEEGISIPFAILKPQELRGPEGSGLFQSICMKVPNSSQQDRPYTQLPSLTPWGQGSSDHPHTTQHLHALPSLLCQAIGQILQAGSTRVKLAEERKGLEEKLRVGGEDIRRSVASESDRKAGWELEQPEG